MTPSSPAQAPVGPARMRHRAWLWDALAVAGLTAFVLVLFGRLIFTNRVLASGDVWTYFVPYRHYATTAVLHGRLPLWNPYLFLGAPFLANSQAAVFYPFHVLLDDIGRAINGTIVLHAWLGGLLTFLWLRLGRQLTPLAALLGAMIFVGSGFIGGHVGQVNQLEAYIWLPALLWLWDWGVMRPARPPAPPGKLAWAWHTAALLPVVTALALVFTLQLLAGHTQAWYVSAVGLGLYGVARALETFSPTPLVQSSSRVRRFWLRWLRPTLPALAVVGAALVLALGLAAVQLLPTFELSALSPRAGGLGYRDAVAFSLRPQLLAFTLLPAYGADLAQRFASPAYAEYVAYIGVSGLVLALWGVWRGPRRRAALIVLAVVGFLLALGAYNPLYFVAYRVVPGWDLFRAPARWMLLYTIGAAGLAALGAEALLRPAPPAAAVRRPSWPARWLILAGFLSAAGLVGWAAPGRWTWLSWLTLAGVTVASLFWLDRTQPRSLWTRRLGVCGLCLLVAGELLVASLTLPHTHPTAPEAIASLRNAPAFLLSAQGRGRFLSLSGIRYDPGDQAELTRLFGAQLDQAARYDLIVATKQKEIIAPNLPLFYGLESVDGYDGGLLPLARYVDVQRLFVADDALVPDGRLREQLTRVPPVQLLNLLNTRFVITDKVYDVWLDNVYYDLQFDAPLAPGASWQQSAAPPFAATAVGLMTHLQGAAGVADGTPVARVAVTRADGPAEQFTLYAGADTAEGAWQSGMAHRQARVGHPWPDGSGQDYLSVISLTQPALVESIAVTATLPVGQLQLRGISLIDARTGTGQALVTTPDHAFRRVHSGDVKIYENLDLLDRAYVLPAAAVQFVADRASALAALRDPAFDPRHRAVIESAAPPGADISHGPSTAVGQAEITTYLPEQVVISTTLSAPGYLVLSDANYPGWRAWVDGAPAPVLTANLLLRAVPLPAGAHQVEFRFQPDSLQRGMIISLVTVAALVLMLAVARWYRR